MSYTGHVDTFAEDRLPSPDAMPQLKFDLPALQYPEKLNAAEWLLDRQVEAGNGDRRCMLAPGVAWTYAELQRTSNAIAAVLVEEHGLVPGNRVLLRAPNTPLLVACWFAVLKAGGIAVVSMPLYRAVELRFMLEKAQVRLALCDHRLHEELSAACDGLDVATAYFGSGRPNDLETRMSRFPGTFHNVGTAAEDVALIAFTSGTTGTPKAAMHYHRDILATCDSYGAHVLQPKADDLFCGSAPLAFTFGLGGHVLFPMAAAAAT
ncbi:MAG: AMP-binding protein, partial [Candidatus Eremiobacteraeota bacterium]|nr:AMP-binding protein [Candidatus Eremiobacteraeota bacterium]